LALACRHRFPPAGIGPGPSDAVLVARPTAVRAAAQAQSADDQPVSLGAELVKGRDGVEDLPQVGARELDQRLAPGAVEVIVLRVAVVVLVDGPAAEHHLPQQTGFDELGERPVDRRPARGGAIGGAAQIGEELLGVEVLVAGTDMLDNHPSLPRDPLPPGLEKLLKPLARRQRHVDLAEREIGGGGHDGRPQGGGNGIHGDRRTLSRFILTGAVPSGFPVCQDRYSGGREGG